MRHNTVPRWCPSPSAAVGATRPFLPLLVPCAGASAAAASAARGRRPTSAARSWRRDRSAGDTHHSEAGSTRRRRQLTTTDGHAALPKLSIPSGRARDTKNTLKATYAMHAAVGAG